jgi:hypothetical protein
MHIMAANYFNNIYFTINYIYYPHNVRKFWFAVTPKPSRSARTRETNPKTDLTQLGFRTPVPERVRVVPYPAYIWGYKEYPSIVRGYCAVGEFTAGILPFLLLSTKDFVSSPEWHIIRVRKPSWVRSVFGLVSRVLALCDGLGMTKPNLSNSVGIINIVYSKANVTEKKNS